MSTPDPDATARVVSATPFSPTPRGIDAQFAPGTIIAGRYRIASILGSGGMGEVYRADDTKLGQTVALKFLPARLARDPILLGRLHDEVRLGRVVAHPNVCRIYDIVDADGAHFVAMEYVDGEDLSRLLRRIGRLAHDKAVDISRGIAAGLLAAHAKGTLHRDLKPANVMIDSRGDARIMDFGLALAAGEDDGTISGTPAYMAPEQIGGDPATIQSDLYALGLVMYELFTGRRAHSARSLHERARDIHSEIATPSSVIRDIDPAVERVILRCLANDPAERPRSAREVIEALPGGDPLAAALAAGETPSPRVVAAAGTEGSVKPWAAWTLLAATLACLFATVAGKRLFSVSAYVSLDKSAEVLRERAVTTLRALGVPAQTFRTQWYSMDGSYFAWVYRDRSPRRWERLRGGPVLIGFTVAESAQPLDNELRNKAVMWPPGTSVATIDGRGRLVELTVRPLRDWPARPLDWKPLLAAAGFDLARLKPATPRMVPGAAADARAAWSGRYPESDTPLHIEAAAWHGTPVFLAVTGPWESAGPASLPFSDQRLAGFLTTVVLAVVAVGLLLAWRNMRLRRGDRAGALRVAAAMLVLDLAAELLSANHAAAGLHEVHVLQKALAQSLLWAAIVYVLYLALEPLVRRRWPSLLIASGRLLAGRVRDPMVGRDVLIGLLVGLGHSTLILSANWVARQRGLATTISSTGSQTLTGTREAIAYIVDALASGGLQGFLFVIVLVTFLLILRKRPAAVAGLFVLMMTGFYLALGSVQIVSVLIALLLVGATARYGLLMIAVAMSVFHVVFGNQLFTTASWDSIQLLPIVVVAATAGWAFYTSLGGQSPFSATLLD